MSKSNQFAASIARSPFLWGIFGSVGFYALVHAGPLGVTAGEAVLHPPSRRVHGDGDVRRRVWRIDRQGIEIAAQRAGLGEFVAGPATKTLQPVEECDALLARLDRLPRGVRANTTSAVCVRRWSTSAVAARPTRWTTS